MTPPTQRLRSIGLADADKKIQYRPIRAPPHAKHRTRIHSRPLSGVGAGPLAPLQVAFGPLALTTEGSEQLGRDISPINYVSEKLPLTLIIHGDRDDVVPLQQSETFVARARSAGAAHVDLIVRAGKGHGWGDFWKSTEDITAFADWFDRHLKKNDRCCAARHKPPRSLRSLGRRVSFAGLAAGGEP